MADVSAEQLSIAENKLVEVGLRTRAKAIVSIDGLDLEIFGDASFDAVIALGPYYHLISLSERIGLARAIARVMRPGGLLHVAFIPRLSGIVGMFSRAASWAAQVPPEILEEVASSGIFRNPTEGGFQEGYYSTPQEMMELFSGVGFVNLELRAVQGIAAGHEHELMQIRERCPALYESAMQIVVDTSKSAAAV